MSSNSEKGSSDSPWIKWVAVVISLLTILLNYQTFISNEKLRKIEVTQNQTLNQQRLLLEQQNADFDSRFKVFEQAINLVEKNNQKQLKLFLALVQSLPKSDYSDTLFSILKESSNPQIKGQVINALVKDRLSEENSEWVYKPYSEAIAGFTDYKIFTCNSASSDLTTEKLLTSTLQAFDNSQRIGTIKVKKWKNISQFSLQELRGKTTVITDKKHPEKKEAERVINEIVTKLKDIPSVNYQDNRGKRTSWEVSIVLCPES